MLDVLLLPHCSKVLFCRLLFFERLPPLAVLQPLHFREGPRQLVLLHLCHLPQPFRLGPLRGLVLRPLDRIAVLPLVVEFALNLEELPLLFHGALNALLRPLPLLLSLDHGLELPRLHLGLAALVLLLHLEPPLLHHPLLLLDNHLRLPLVLLPHLPRLHLPLAHRLQARLLFQLLLQFPVLLLLVLLGRELLPDPLLPGLLLDLVDFLLPLDLLPRLLPRLRLLLSLRLLVPVRLYLALLLLGHLGELELVVHHLLQLLLPLCLDALHLPLLLERRSAPPLRVQPRVVTRVVVGRRRRGLVPHRRLPAHRNELQPLLAHKRQLVPPLLLIVLPPDLLDVLRDALLKERVLVPENELLRLDALPLAGLERAWAV
mmetsp:Transcript_24241/g.47006  ORF Transcript_24241/g.47006 Transcript_24241/m.47006 type:complete len:374 (+) Transcript_24241:496-1617(+)